MKVLGFNELEKKESPVYYASAPHIPVTITIEEDASTNVRDFLNLWSEYIREDSGVTIDSQSQRLTWQNITVDLNSSTAKKILDHHEWMTQIRKEMEDKNG